VYREDERTLAELAAVRRSLANSAEALLPKAFVDRRQDRWEEAIAGMHRALSLDSRHQIFLGALGDTYYWLRCYREVEQIFDRLIELAPDKPSLKAFRASVALEGKGNLASYRTVMEGLPSSSRNTLWITSLRFQSAVLARNWKDAERVLNGSPYSELYFIRNDPRFEKLLAQLTANQGLQKTPSRASRVGTRRPPARLGPKNISVARLPVTGSELFGREEDIAFLDDAWANTGVNVVTIVAWAGVGKSTLINHWLRRMAADHYRSAEFVFGWSFYRQGTSSDTSSADEFLDAALHWFGDPDPRLGTAWEKGERLAKLVAHRRTLLVLDGLEPLQNPPGAQEGRLRHPSLQALLRELAAWICW
jgi:tetratricopeptide (TPR) repeat protein